MPETEFYQKWMLSLESKLTLPSLPGALLTAFAQLQPAQQVKQTLAHEKGVMQIKARQNPAITPADIEQAQLRVDEQSKIVQQAMEKVQQEYAFAAQAIDDALLVPDSPSFFNDWMTYILLKTHTPANWAKAPLQEQCMDLLQDDHELQYQILLAGGAMKHETPKAIAIYMQLQEIITDESPASHAVFWDKVALAVALELCVPLPVFGQPGVFVDPIERYRHYEMAFLQGELDPYFEHYTVFELRHAINSDAGSSTLTWGRETLRNFRPQLLYESSPAWRYSEMVKTDVPYKTPEWYKGYQSYDQLLQGGGKCGPRAWFGRFICKAFGIPTWGAKQQGHAAMARWTEHGWETNLGGGFRANFWEGRCGLHFQLETQVRNLLGETEYVRQILPMIWYAIRDSKAKKSPGDCNHTVQMEFQPSGDNVWLSLALMKCQRLVQNATAAGTPMGVSYPRSCSIRHNKVQMILDAPSADQCVRMDHTTGRTIIVIPASAPLQRPANKVWFPKSCLGGKQLLMNGPIALEYEIPVDASHDGDETYYYKVTLRVCVIKQHVDPVQISWKGSTAKQVIQIPDELCGAWQWTTPCALECITSCSRILVLERLTQQHLIAMKEFRLEPMSAEEYSSLLASSEK